MIDRFTLAPNDIVERFIRSMQLYDANKADLLEFAGRLGVRGRSRLTKADLRTAIFACVEPDMRPH